MYPYNRAEGYGHGITNIFVLANSGPNDDNGSFIIKFLASSLIFMLLSPPSLLSISNIYDFVIEYSYNNSVNESSIKIKSYDLKE